MRNKNHYLFLRLKPMHSLLLVLFLFCHMIIYAQESNTVKGSVSDNENGEFLPGVSVVVKGTLIGTTTDFDGNFSIEVPQNEATLVFSYIGFLLQEISVANAVSFDVKMVQDVTSLDEVVVVGYGTESKRNIISSVSSLDSQGIEDRPVVNFQESLSGKLPGVSISQSNGAPGAGLSVNIRGVGSITGGTEPLYVIDGVPLSNNGGDKFNQGNDNYNYTISPLNSINPNDIKNIQVLKDASATSIYGSRGANGVVIITTKGGQYKKGPSVSFNSYGGVSQLARKVKVMDAYQHANYTKMARDLSWVNKDPQNHSASDPMSVRNIDDRYPSYMFPYFNGQTGLTNTDWQDEFYRTGIVQNYDLSVNGGTEKTRYFISANYMGQEGIIPNSGIKKIGMRLKLETEITDKLRVGVNLNPTYIDNNLAKSEKNWGSEGLVIGTLMQHPQLPVYNEDGSYAVDRLFEVAWSGESNVVQFQNPVALANLVDNQMQQFRMIFNSEIEYDILKDLAFKTVIGGDISYNTRNYYRPKSLSYRNEPAPTSYQNLGEVFNSSLVNYLWDNTLTYKKTFNDHSLNVVLGTSVQKELNKNSLVTGRDFATDNVRTINTSQERYGSESQREWSLLSYFGRANYNYKGKYLMSGTIRTDGSSKFGKESKWGVFPSISLGWRLSDEDFFQLDVVDEMKIRTSYGLSGNNDIPYYGAIALLSTNGKYTIGDNVYSGLYPSTSPNPSLSWETTKSFNIGFDFGFAQNYTFSGDYYISNTTDLLLNVPVPSTSGYSNSLQNTGELQNKGLELSLGTSQKLFGGDLNMTLNFSTNTNKVLSLGPGQEQIISSGGLSGSHVTRIGHPVGSFFGYKVLGKFESEEQLNSLPKLGNQRVGDFIYQDTDGNQVVNAEDRVILGDNLPDYEIGFNLGYTFKGFDISASIFSKQGQEVINTMHRYLAEAWGNNLSVYLSEDAPRPVWGVGSNTHTRASSWQIEDASYVSLREVMIGYTLPSKVTKILNASRIRVYASLLNPVTWTNYSGYNPDVSSNYGSALTPGEEFGNYPSTKTSTIGINVSF